MGWLEVRTQDGSIPLTSEEIREFAYEGERFALMDPQRGIRKPAGFASALSIRTVWRPSGAERPYEDAIGDDGLVRYKWRGDDPDHAENRALRAAMDAGQPLALALSADQQRHQQADAGAVHVLQVGEVEQDDRTGPVAGLIIGVHQRLFGEAGHLALDGDDPHAVFLAHAHVDVRLAYVYAHSRAFLRSSPRKDLCLVTAALP